MGARKRFYADLHIHSRFSRASSPMIARSEFSGLVVATRRKAIGLMGCGALALFAWMAPGYEPVEDLAAEGLLRKRLVAMGGADALSSLKSRRIVGRIEFETALESALIIIEAAAPTYLRTTIELSGIGPIVEAYDGRVAWRKTPGSPAYKLTGAEAARLRRAADFYWDLHLEAAYSNWKRNGVEDLDGSAAYHLSGVDVSQRRIHLWLDQESWLLTAMERVGWFGPFSAEGVRLQYSDYRPIDGVQIPFLIRQTSPQASAYELRVESVTHGIEFDEHRFRWSEQDGRSEVPVE